MAKRYRYAFTKKKEARKGIIAVFLAVLSFLLFFAAIWYSLQPGASGKHVTGMICLAAVILAMLGFIGGLWSFLEKDVSHRSSIVGSIANGLLFVMWLGIYLLGV